MLTRQERKCFAMEANPRFAGVAFSGGLLMSFETCVSNTLQSGREENVSEEISHVRSSKDTEANEPNPFFDIAEGFS